MSTEAILPRFPPPGRAFDIAIGVRVLLKKNVMLAADDALRRLPDGEMEYQPDSPGDEWLPVPDHVVALPLGQPIQPEFCDVELVPVIQYANVAIRDKNGAASAGAHVPERVSIARFDFKAFVEACEQSLPTSTKLVGL